MRINERKSNEMWLAIFKEDRRVKEEYRIAVRGMKIKRPRSN